MAAIISDDTLYRRYLDGEEAAMRELMERHGDHLTRYISGILHDAHDAEDLMIDAFTYLVAKKPNIRAEGFRAYLFQTARHYALRYVARLHKNPTFCLDELEQEPQSAERLDELVIAKARSVSIHLCMEQLTPDYREALYLIYFEGMSYKEAAAIMKKSEKQIDNLVQRGKKSLCGYLEKEGITGAYN